MTKITGFAALAEPMTERQELRDEEIRTGFHDTLPAYPDQLPPWKKVSPGLTQGSAGSPHKRSESLLIGFLTAAALAGLAAWMGHSLGSCQHAGLLPLAVLTGTRAGRSPRLSADRPDGTSNQGRDRSPDVFEPLDKIEDLGHAVVTWLCAVVAVVMILALMFRVTWVDVIGWLAAIGDAVMGGVQ